MANSLGQSIGEGDEIILSIMEHHSNIVPWHFLRERKGDGHQVGAGARGRVVRLRGVRAVADAAHQDRRHHPHVQRARHGDAHQGDRPRRPCGGAKVVVDGCQASVHLPVDVRDLDVDFYAVTGHKLYGPTGIGLLYGKRALLAEMPPYEGGGEMIREVEEGRVTYAEPPHRFEAGTPPIVQAIGLGAALDYMDLIGREAIAAHEHQLSLYAHEQLGR